jgi:hypothetical protein
MFVTASLHVLLLVSPGRGWFSFGDLRDSLFGPHGYMGPDNLWSAANWVGLFALGYVLVLAATSNDFSQRLLGRVGSSRNGRRTHCLFWSGCTPLRLWST